MCLSRLYNETNFGIIGYMNEFVNDPKHRNILNSEYTYNVTNFGYVWNQGYVQIDPSPIMV